MKIVKTIQEVRENVKAWRAEGLTVGLVTTMGFLHEGHQSLIQRAVKENDRVVVSIFVNPIQFGENEDFDSYPKDLERDSLLCSSSGADLIFHPDNEEMYCENFCSYVDMTGLTDALCGKSRPKHFRGVCTVVTKLFNIVKPDRAYFGQKDAQQAAVIERMVRDLNMDIQIVVCEIIREADGLARSSRNVYLNKEERTAALVLHGALEIAENMIKAGARDTAEIKKAIKDKINSEKLARIDYAEIVDLGAFKSIGKIDMPVMVALAVFIGKTRLIDNYIYRV